MERGEERKEQIKGSEREKILHPWKQRKVGAYV